jgi:putative endonuclease
MAWTVYMLECADSSLYTGITLDLERRLAAHAKGKGAKYTKHRGPFTLVFTERQETRGQALKREAAIKSMKRKQKLGLIGTRKNDRYSFSPPSCPTGVNRSELSF